MCLHPEEIPLVPEATVKSAFPKGNLDMRLRDELGVFYHDEDFTSPGSTFVSSLAFSNGISDAIFGESL